MSDRLFAGALTLLGLVAALLVWASHDDRGDPGDDPGAGAEVVRADLGPASGRAAARAGASEAPSTDAGAAPGAGRLGGVEVLPDDAPAGGPTTLSRATPPPRLESPLPAAASMLGGVVAGYPTRILPVPPGSQVDASSVSPAANSLQVTLQGQHRQAGRAVLRYFRLELTANGFRERSVPAAGARTAAAFGRGPDSVVVTVTGTGRERTSYVVFATLHLR